MRLFWLGLSISQVDRAIDEVTFDDLYGYLEERRADHQSEATLSARPATDEE